MTNPIGIVLVIDDQPEMRQLFQRVLEHQGHRVVCAGNGQEGLRALQTCPAQVVLLDMAMPEMDGLTFLRALRNQPKWKELPVIILSGLMSAEQVAAARSLGVTDQLVKAQFSMRELRALVARHLPSVSSNNLSMASG